MNAVRKSPLLAATKIEFGLRRTMAIVAVVAAGGVGVHGRASLPGGVSSQGIGTSNRTVFGDGEVVGFGVILGLFGSEIEGLRGIFEVGLGEGSNLGCGASGARSCVTDGKSIVTCGAFDGFGDDFDAHPVNINMKTSTNNNGV